MLPIPTSVNYPNALNAVPLDTYDDPRDGKRLISLELIWANAITAGVTAFSVNIQNNATLEFSKISGLAVDNSQCGADIDFLFPDTGVTITVPAYAPYTAVPVHSNQEQFFVKSRGAINGDVTEVQLLNYAPPPVAIPITTQQKTAAIGNTNIINGTTQLVANTVNGTLQGLNINFTTNAPPANFNALIQIKDGTGAIIWAGNVSAMATSTGESGELCSINGLNVRFQQGLTAVVTGVAAASGTFSTNLYYIIP